MKSKKQVWDMVFNQPYTLKTQEIVDKKCECCEKESCKDHIFVGYHFEGTKEREIYICEECFVKD